MATIVDLEAADLARYLQLVHQQRKRTKDKLAADFGETSPAAIAVADEMRGIMKALNNLRNEPTPLEEAIAKKTK